MVLLVSTCYLAGFLTQIPFTYWSLLYLPAIYCLYPVYFMLFWRIDSLPPSLSLALSLFHFKGSHLIHLLWAFIGFYLSKQCVCIILAESEIKRGYRSDDHSFCPISASFGAFVTWESHNTSQIPSLLCNISKIICLLHRVW